jgi:hypothetical protein
MHVVEYFAGKQLQCTPCSFRTQYVTKPMGHAFGLRAKTMLLAQYKLFYVKEFLITDYSKAFCIAILGKWSHF